MALAWLGGSKQESLSDLIARRKYGKAIEALRAQFHDGVRDPSIRLQLADVLVLAGRKQEAAPILQGLADEFARQGFAGKAIAVLKKLERIAPGRADVQRRLAELIQRKRETEAPPRPASTGEIGIEDLGIAAAAISSPVQTPSPEAGATPTPSPAPRAAPAAEEGFEEEFLLALDDMVEAAHSGAPEAGPRAAIAPPVASPLLSDFAEAELLALIDRFLLLSYEPGDIVVSEGESGDSLFVLASGTLKVFVRDKAGRNALVREMGDGSFFGELSLLTGLPRTATVTCATRCELLELDREALAAVAGDHPRVRDVILEAAAARAESAQERRARGHEARPSVAKQPR